LFPSRWHERLKQGLSRTRAQLAQVFRRTQLDAATYEALEEALLLTDMGASATQTLLNALAQHVRKTGDTSVSSARLFLVHYLAQELRVLEKSWTFQAQGPTVIMVCGVNGAGKTTSLGKWAYQLQQQGKRVLLAAGDTFRAGAGEQLAGWAQRTGAGFVPSSGTDSAAVAFSAVQQAVKEAWDVVLIDTAGRLATQANLMQEMQKIQRVIGKALPGAPHETVLVLDGHTGQNALAQVKAFDDALHLSGLVMTKLDGTAKGGALVALALAPKNTTDTFAATTTATATANRSVPVMAIGIGEQANDFHPFEAEAFAQALLGETWDAA
jgi:fused signal recognition particle receptor